MRLLEQGDKDASQLARELGLRRNQLYKWKLENRALLVEIRRIFMANREVYGAPRIDEGMMEMGYQCSLNRVVWLMQAANMVPKTVRKFRVTTDSRKSRYPAENLLKQHFNAERQDEKWVADVTYIPTRECFITRQRQHSYLGYQSPVNYEEKRVLN